MKSVKNIQKITKAMKMVAASKLRAVQTRAENSRGLWQPFTALLGDNPSMFSYHYCYYLILLLYPVSWSKMRMNFVLDFYELSRKAIISREVLLVRQWSEGEKKMRIWIVTNDVIERSWRRSWCCANYCIVLHFLLLLLLTWSLLGICNLEHVQLLH